MIRTEIVVTKNNFPAIRKQLHRNANGIVREAALDIEAEAKTRAPVDTGNLKNSIQATQAGDMHWRVTVGAEYGVYVEFGTRFMTAQPFLIPAYRDVLPHFMANMRNILGWAPSGGGVAAEAAKTFSYTTKSGKTRQATAAQIANWTRGTRA